MTFLALVVVSEKPESVIADIAAIAVPTGRNAVDKFKSLAIFDHAV